MGQRVIKIVIGFLFLIFTIQINGCSKNEIENNDAVLIDLDLSNPQTSKIRAGEPAILTLKVINRSGENIYLENFFPIPFTIREKTDRGFEDITENRQHPHPIFFAEWDCVQNKRYQQRLNNQKSPPDSLLSLISDIVFKDSDNFDEKGLKMLLGDIYERRIYLKKSDTFEYSMPLDITTLSPGKYQVISDVDNPPKFFEESLQILKKHGIKIPKNDDGFIRWSESIKGDALTFKI